MGTVGMGTYICPRAALYLTARQHRKVNLCLLCGGQLDQATKDGQQI